jgi:hypothetical protein
VFAMKKFFNISRFIAIGVFLVISGIIFSAGFAEGKISREIKIDEQKESTKACHYEEIEYKPEALKAYEELLAVTKMPVKGLSKCELIAEAKKWLTHARKIAGNNEKNVGLCIAYLVKAGASFRSIGTSVDELQALLDDGYAVEGMMCFEYIEVTYRHKLSDVDGCLDFFKKAGISPERIEKIRKKAVEKFHIRNE